MKSYAIVPVSQVKYNSTLAIYRPNGSERHDTWHEQKTLGDEPCERHIFS